MKNKFFFHMCHLFLLIAAALFIQACSSTSTPGADGTCAEGTNDFYVVENASCVAGAGKLSRINPDDICKEEILVDLDCPVDFVLSTVDAGIGYLSSRTDGILQVDINNKTSTAIATTTNIVSPAGLFLLENITDAEREGPCGGNTLVDAILMIADEGTELDGGMVWRWCLITDEPDILASGLNPSPVSEVSPAQIEHPRGVLVQNRTQVYATGFNPDIEDTTQSALLATWELNEAEIIVPTFLTDPGDFSGDIKDISADSEGGILIADPGQDAALYYNVDNATLAIATGFTGGIRDILSLGVNSDGGLDYLFSQFDDNVVSLMTFTNGSGNTFTSATEGLTLDGPDGMAQ